MAGLDEWRAVDAWGGASMELPSPWLCMDDEEYSRWAEANARTSSTQRVERPCQDCPLSFSREMRAIGRCNGMPSGREYSDDEEEMTVEVARARSKPVTVTVVTPCGRCSHREVCGIRPSIEALDAEGTEVALPPLNPALTPTLAVNIECGFFSLDRTVPKPGALVGKGMGGPGQPRNLSPEERERRSRHAIAMNAKRAAERAALA